MRYVVDLGQNESNQVEVLIKKGLYKSFAQFITTAIENQLYIESSEPEFEKKIQIKQVFHDKVGHYDEDVEVSLPKVISVSPKLVQKPSFNNLACSLKDLKEEECWLWGQINKVFPIKLGLRTLIIMLDSKQWIELDTFGERAADIALAYKSKILKYEDARNKVRDERISAGLPQPEKNEMNKFNEAYSKKRYRNQFLAYLRKDGKLDGAMSILRFINLQQGDKNSTLIGITEEGLQFAKLENPVIDRQDYEHSLNAQEIDFYLNHVTKNFKGEHKAIEWLLNMLNKGVVSRERLNKELKNTFGTIWKASDLVINTQRAGLIARAYELGLISKTKDGVAVEYVLSKKGADYLKSIKK